MRRDSRKVHTLTHTHTHSACIRDEHSLTHTLGRSNFHTVTHSARNLDYLCQAARLAPSSPPPPPPPQPPSQQPTLCAWALCTEEFHSAAPTHRPNTHPPSENRTYEHNMCVNERARTEGKTPLARARVCVCINGMRSNVGLCVCVRRSNHHHIIVRIVYQPASKRNAIYVIVRSAQ